MLVAIATVLAVLASSAAAETTIEIDKQPIQLERKTFSPAHPPANPAFDPKKEAAFTDSRFSCMCEARAVGKSVPGASEPARVSLLKITLGLRVIIWTPKGGPRSYVEHEETHRAISEHYYRDAELIARAAARRFLEEAKPLPPASRRAELDRALHDVERKVIAAYLAETHERAAWVQDAFDAITQHGRAPISNTSAMARALAEEDAAWRQAHP